MTTIVKAADAAQLLPMIPALFGFTPTRSIVIIPFAHGRNVGGMRIDLPPASQVDSVAATLIGMVCRAEDADAYVAVVFDDTTPKRGLPHSALITALQIRADACGLRTLDALHIGTHRWASYLDADTGGAVRELAAPAGATAFLPPPGEDQHSGGTPARAPKPQRRRISIALHELNRATAAIADPRPAATGGRIHPTALATAALLDDLPEFLEGIVRDHTGEDATGGDHMDTYARAALIWCLQRPALRDVALATWLDGIDAGDAALAAQLRHEDDDPCTEAVAHRMWGEGSQPDAERLFCALDACRRAAAAAPDASRPGALSACAWLSWALGRMTHAEAYARQAMRIEPAHGLSEIVLSFVAASHLPDWAFRNATPRNAT